MEKVKTITRREFIEKTATGAAGLMIVPRRVLGGRGVQAPSDTLNIGCVGVWGKGASIKSSPHITWSNRLIQAH